MRIIKRTGCFETPDQRYRMRHSGITNGWHLWERMADGTEKQVCHLPLLSEVVEVLDQRYAAETQDGEA